MTVKNVTGAIHGDRELDAWLAGGGLAGATEVCAWSADLTCAGARAIAAAEGAAALDYADLSWNHVGGAGAAALAARPGMRRLRLYHDDVRAETRELADAGSELELLNLCGNALGDAGVRGLAGGRLTALRELALGYNALTAASARALAAGPWRQLARLNVRANRLDADAIAALLSGELPELVWLGVDENPLGDAGLAALLASPGFARLEWLNLGGTELDDRAVARFAAAAPCALRELRVHDNDLSPRALHDLRAALPGCYVRA